MTLREIMASWFAADDRKIAQALKDGLLVEVKHVQEAKTNRRLTEELLETAQDMRASGLMSKAAHEKITMRHLGDAPAAVSAVPIG